jgi:glucosamine-6-phosphate deaminase
MHIRVFATPPAAARALAAGIAGAIARQPAIVLGLPTGRTPIPLYDQLIELCAARAVD